MKLAWLTDIHLNFFDAPDILKFLQSVQCPTAWDFQANLPLGFPHLTQLALQPFTQALLPDDSTKRARNGLSMANVCWSAIFKRAMNSS